ncbi:MAG TPA: hypothetical protein VFT65_06515 [Candidatus Angelobacter sp.]|nr:hypothetical protein [Candidatus Angelobacter sp.]
MKHSARADKHKRLQEISFRPGDTVPASGVYCVEHAQHHLMHTATMVLNGRFPRCKECGNAVRFTLIRKVKDWCAIPFRTTAILEEYLPQILLKAS